MSTQEAAAKPEAVWSHRVFYGETDAMGVVYYANYLHWFEQARNQLLLDKGTSYGELEARGVYLPANEAYCHYRDPARFEHLVQVRVWIENWGRASLTFFYRVNNLSLEGRLITEGWTRHACMSQNGRAQKIPPWFRDLFTS